MSITSDIRGYADAAVEQGRAVASEFLGQAQTLTAKATVAANDLRVQAEKAVNIDAIKSAVEPYLAQARQYRSGVTDRADDLYAAVRNDKRFAQVFAAAEQVADVLVGTVQERVVKPVLSMAERGAKPAPTTPSTKPAAKTAPRKPATTRPAAKATASASNTTKSTTAKSAPRKPAAKKSTPKA